MEIEAVAEQEGQALEKESEEAEEAFVDYQTMDAPEIDQMKDVADRTKVLSMEDY